MKHLCLFVFMVICFLSFFPHSAHAAKAVAIVQSSQSIPGGVSVMIGVTDDQGVISLSTGFTVSFASSPNQTNADIKIKVRGILAQYGVILNTTDIVLFGGAQ